VRRRYALLAALASTILVGPACGQESLPPSADAAGEVLATEDARFRAMIEADADAIEELLHTDLVYTHTSGEADDKSGILGAIVSGALDYLAIEPDEREVVLLGDVAVVTGRSRMRVATGGRELAFGIRFTSVYARGPAEPAAEPSWRLVAWQSTRLPEP
jgi:hypothetical protein